MVEVDLIKLPGGVLKASLPEDEEKLDHWGQGEILRAKVTKPNNSKLHKKLMALVSVIFDGQERYTDREKFRFALSIVVGFCDGIIMPDGTISWKPKSWSFADTDGMTREKLYSDVIDAGIKVFLPARWTEEEINKQVDRVLRFI